MDILLIDEKIKKYLKNTEELLFYIFDTADIIDNYKKILSKPILRSNENKREKSDIIEEYINIVNFNHKDAYYQYKPLEIEKLTPPPLPKIEKLNLPKIETLEEYEKMIKKLKKAAKTKKTILPTYVNETEEYIKMMNRNYFQHTSPKMETLKELYEMDKKKQKNFLRSYEKIYLKNDKYHPMIDLKEILYYEPKSNKKNCKNCNGTNITKEDDCEYREDCEDCGLLIERANFIYYYPEKRTSLRKKKKNGKS